MKRLLRILGALFLLLVFLVAIAFAFRNTTPVALYLWPWTFAPRPVAVWVLLAFTVGGLLGLLFGSSFTGYFRNRRELNQLRRRLRDAEAEVSRLREAAPREPT